MIILSILIPTIKERAGMFTVLHNEVIRQVKYIDDTHPTLGQIEVLFDDSARYLDGGLSIGHKRQALLDRSKGKYVCFLDDDESIAPNYAETLVRLCVQNKDVCTFRNISKLDNFWMIVNMGLAYQNNEATPRTTVKRKPWHICPVKSVYAKKYRFDNLNYGEDWHWMEKVLRHCRTEAKTDAIIHQYNHGKHSEADKITKHEELQPK